MNDVTIQELSQLLYWLDVLWQKKKEDYEGYDNINDEGILEQIQEISALIVKIYTIRAKKIYRIKSP